MNCPNFFILVSRRGYGGAIQAVIFPTSFWILLTAEEDPVQSSGV